MAVKKDKKRQRGVSQAKCETLGRIVLVGTYKRATAIRPRTRHRVRVLQVQNPDILVEMASHRQLRTAMERRP